MPKAAIKSSTEIAQQEIFARAFQEIETPITELRLAAQLAERAADDIGESTDDVQRAIYAVRHVAEVAQKLEQLWLDLYNPGCEARL